MEGLIFVKEIPSEKYSKCPLSHLGKAHSQQLDNENSGGILITEESQ